MGEITGRVQKKGICFARKSGLCYKSVMGLTPGKSSAEACLARSVADTLAEEPSLEAVTFDVAQNKISVATLGLADVEKLTRRLTEQNPNRAKFGRWPRPARC